MNALQVIAALNASLQLSATLLPIVKDLSEKGEISKEEQASVLAKYESLKAQADGQFSGPEWQIR